LSFPVLLPVPETGGFAQESGYQLANPVFFLSLHTVKWGDPVIGPLRSSLNTCPFLGEGVALTLWVKAFQHTTYNHIWQ
jgi:hypothetical protein